MLGIFCPTYGRPTKLQEVATNIEQSTKGDFTLYWGCEPEDTASIQAARATGHRVIVNEGKMGYADTIQTIYGYSDEDIFFHANDDFEFLNGWDIAPLNFLAEHPEVMVLGAHDGSDQPSYSTIAFVRREYIEEMSGVVDMPKRVFYPYHHNYVDTEFTRTAQARGVWEKIETPCIKHNRTGGDETYRKNDVTSPEDFRTFTGREHLWINIKEETMARKPMSEEKKQAARERMRVYWDGKKAKETSVSPKITERPPESETGQSAMVGRALGHINNALESLAMIRQKNPEVIEAAQAVDALVEAGAKAGQLQGILTNK